METKGVALKYGLTLFLCLLTPLLFAAGYSEKNDLPHTPFSDFFAPVKEVPIAGGFTFSMGGSMQTRFQGLDNRRDFSSQANDQDFSVLNRTRLNFDIHQDKTFKFFLELQDAHEIKRDNLRGLNPNENSFDIYQGYGELGLLYDVCDKPSLVFRVGRQTLAYGHGHFFGEDEWLNTGTQNFDLVKTIWRPDGFQIDAFAGRPVRSNNENPDSASKVNIAGANLKALGVPLGHNIEGIFVYKWNENVDSIGEPLVAGGVPQRGPERLAAIGALADGHFWKNWDYSLEVDFEAGVRGGDNVKAWRGIAELGYKQMIFNWRSIRFAFNYSQSSGDKNPFDGQSETFDPLFASQFGHHGRILATGGKNLEDYYPRVEARLWRGGLIELDYHLDRLVESRDAFYQANGRPLRRDVTGKAGKRAAQELDVQVTHTFHDNLSITGGAFFFEPDRLFRKTGNRQDDTARNFFFMVRVNF